MKIEYIKISDNSWDEVKESALTTIHKKHTDSEISDYWKHNIMKSEHSPIREMEIRIKVSDVPRWIADQLVRHHIGVTSYMGTGRPDRGNKLRYEMTMEEPTVLKMTMNAQAFINISRERLCVGCVSKETRELWESILEIVKDKDYHLWFRCVPSCVHQAGCKEFKECGHFRQFIGFLYGQPKVRPVESLINIDSRYTLYHTWREK